MKSPRTLHPICDRLCSIFAVPLIAYLLVPAPLLAQSIVVTVAPDSGETRVYDTSGGTVVVDIDTPNDAGLSHNRYTDYNVPNEGLILNNAAPEELTVASQIASEVLVNFNLAPGQTASVILNEVVAPNVSTIAGFTEVVGDTADVVVANPYGISVQGGGFLNTSRVTLATGTPQLGADGGLARLSIDGGRLVIAGAGLDGSNLDYLSLLGRSVTLDGQVHANDLTVGAGPATYDYVTGELTAESASADVPSYAIDSTLLGGLYADRIRLVATEAGVGVRMLGEAAATADDFTIDAAGRVQLSGQAYAERDLTVNAAGGVEVSGAEASITAQRDLVLAGAAGGLVFSDAEIVAGNQLALSGASLSDTSVATPASANRFAMSGIDLDIDGEAAVAGSIYGSATTVDFTAGSITLGDAAGVYGGADADATENAVSLVATTGNLSTGNATLVTPGTLDLTAHLGHVAIGAGESTSGLSAGGNITLQAGTAIDSSGTVIAGGDLNIGPVSAGNSPLGTTNSGQWQAVGNVILEGVNFHNTATGVVVGDTLAVEAGALTNDGAMQGTNGVTLTVAEQLLTGTDSVILTAGDPGKDITIQASSLNTSGRVQATGDIAVNVTGAAVQGGTFATLSVEQGGAAGLIDFDADSLTNSGTIASASTLDIDVGAGGDSTVSNSGTLQAAGNVTLDVGATLDNAAGGQILAGGNLALGTEQTDFALTNAGRMQADGQIGIATADVLTTLTQTVDGVTYAGGALDVLTTTLDNAGTMQAGGALDINVLGLANNREDGAILTAGTPGLDLTFTSAELNNAGRMQSTGALGLTTSVLDNSGIILTQTAEEGGVGGDVLLDTDMFTNTGTVRSGGSLHIATGPTLLNGVGGQLIAVQDFSLRRGDAGSFSVDNRGRFEAGGTMVIGSGTERVDYLGSSESVIFAGSTFDLTGVQFDTAGAVQSGDNATLGLLNDFVNSGTMAVGPTALANLNLSANALDNSGTLSTSGETTVALAANFDNTGQVQSGGDLSVTAQRGYDNKGNVLSSGDITLQSGASDFDFSNSGRVQAEGTVDIGQAGALATVTNLASGDVIAGRELTAVTKAVDTAGLFQAGRDLTVSSTNALVNDTSGAILTTGTPGAHVVLTADNFTNRGSVQSVGDFTGTFANLFTNAGTILTLAGANGGADGDITTVSSLFTNTGTVSSAGDLSITTTTTDTVSLINSGVIEAVGDASIVAPFAINNQADAVISAGANLDIQGAGAFTFTNAGTVQSGLDLMLGKTGAVVNLDNVASGLMSAGADFALIASVISNAGTLQAANVFNLTSAGTWDNSGSVFATTMNAEVGQILNSGAMAFSEDLNLITASSFTNSGRIEAADAITVTVPDFFTNTTAAELIAGGSLAIQSGAAGFTLTNTGTVQSGADTVIGTTGAEVALTNNAGGAVLAGTTSNLTASNLNNVGTLQSTGAMTLTVSGDLSNTATGLILTTSDAGSDLTVAADSFTNAGTVQSTGDLGATITHAFDNSGTVATLASAVGGTDGDITTTSATVTNSGLINAAADLALTTTDGTGTSMTNSGTIQSVDNITFTTPGVVSNGADALISAGNNLVLQSGSGDFDLNNIGTVQAGVAMTVGTSGAEVTFDNAATGVLLAGATMDVAADDLTNAGTVQAGDEMTLSINNALSNTATGLLLGAGSGSAVMVTADSLDNVGTVQAAGDLSLTIADTITNSGNVLTTDGSALVVRAESLTNSGTIQSAETAHFTLNLASGNSLANSGTILAADDATFLVGGTLNNTVTGTIDAGSDLMVNNGSDVFAITNAGVLHATSDITLGLAGGRGELTNTADALILADGALDVQASMVTNSGTLQAQDSANVNVTGDLTNTATGILLNVGDTPAALTLTASDFTNAGTVQSTGTFTGTFSADAVNSGTIIAEETFALTTATLDNSGTIDVTDAATLTTTGSAATTATNSGTIQVEDDFTITAQGGLHNRGADAKLLAGGDLAMNTMVASNVTNDGILQAGGTITVGSAGHRGTLTNTATLLGQQTTDVFVTDLTNTGRVQSTDDLTVNATGAVANAATDAVILTTATDAGIDITAESFTSSGAVQSADVISINASDTLINSGDLISAVGSTLELTDATLTNSGRVQSGATTTFSATDLTNSGTITSTGDLQATTTQSFNNTASGVIDTDGTFRHDGFTAGATGTNAGTIQADGAITLSAPATSADWTNSGNVLTAESFTANATNFTNSGTVQATDTVTITTSEALSNQSGGVILNTDGAPASIVLSGASFTNAGTVQSTGGLNLTYSGTATSSGTLLAKAPLVLTADNFTNSGAVDVTGDATLTTTGSAATTMTNRGTMRVTEALTITAPGAFDNDTAAAKIVVGGALNLNTTTVGDVSNDGLIQSSGALTIGSTSHRGALNTTTGSTILTEDQLALFHTDVTHGGAIQGPGAWTLDATGAITTQAGSIIMNTGDTPAQLTLTGASLNNAGKLQSTGATEVTTTGALISSGDILSPGDLTLTGATITNSGTIDADADATLTASGSAATTVTNSGTVVVANDLAIVAPGAFDNDTADAKLSAGGTLIINGGVAGDIRNGGLIQSTGAMTLGNAAQRAALTTTVGSSILAADTLALHRSDVTNDGTIQATGAFTFDVTGAVSSTSADARIASVGVGNAFTVTGSSLNNAGTIQSADALTITTTGAATNSGSLLSSDGFNLTVQGTALTNSGTIQSGNDATLVGTSLVNSGTLHAAKDIALTTTTSLENTASGVIDADGVINHGGFGIGTGTNAGTIQADGAITFHGPTASANWTNSGSILSGAAFGATSTNFTNSGTVQAAGALALTANGTLNNQAAGKILTTGTAGNDLTLTTGTLTNAGVVQSVGDITATATGAATNFGTMLTLDGGSGGDAGALSVSTQGAFTNSGTIDGASTVALTAGSTFTNSGGDALITSGGNTTLTTGSAFTADAGSEVISGSDLTIKGNSGFTLTNSGLLQAANTLTAGTSSARAAITNNETGTMLGDDVTLFATGLSNNGTIQATDDLTVTFSGSPTVSNAATGKIMAGDMLKLGTSGSAFTLTNDGLVQSGGTMNLGGTGSKITLTNNAGAKIISDALNVEATNITNGGAISAGAPSTINTGNFTNSGSSSKLVFGHGSGTSTVNYTGVFTNEGAVFGQSGVTITGGTTLNNTDTGGISALGNLAIGATGDINNNGALYSGTNVGVTAGNKFYNSKTGTVDSAGGMTATAGEFENRGKINVSGTADISTTTFRNIDESLTTSSVGVPSWMKNQLHDSFISGTYKEFLRNYPIAMAATAITDSANWGNYFRLAVLGSTTKVDSSGAHLHFQQWLLQDIVADLLYKDGELVTDTSSIDVSNRAQINAGNLTLRDFNYALNQGNLTASGTMNITGLNGSATFDNDSLSLSRTEYTTTAWVLHDDLGGGTYRLTGVLLDPAPVSTQTSSTVYFTSTADVRAGTLNVSNVAVNNKGNPLGASVSGVSTTGADSRSGLGSGFTTAGASASGAGDRASLSPDDLLGSLGLAGVNGSLSALAAGAAGLDAEAGASSSTFTFPGPTTLRVGSTVTSSGSITRATASASTIEAIQAIAQVGASDPTAFSQLLAATLSALDGASYAAGALPADVSAKLADALSAFSLPDGVALSDAITALQALGQAAQLPIARSGSVSLGSLNLNLPSNPNGYFVISPDPQAEFRVTLNDDLGLSSDAVGSNFLAEELGYQPDQIQTRLGDPSYETYLVQQQLTDQLGTTLLAGQTDAGSQMQALMRSAVEVKDAVGLVWGQAPSPAQLRNLTEDIVWMVSQVIDGEELLVPQVYLSEKTRAMFAGRSATIAATDSMTMDVTNLVNSGGDITAGNDMTVNSSGDIENISGQLSAGGDMSLTAAGDISNRRLNADQSTTDNRMEGLGKDAGISGGNVAMQAGGDVENLSATINGGNVSIAADGDITNRTYAETLTRETSARTTIANTASINATGDLALDAGNNINVIGADINAAGGGSLKAGNDIVVDTIEDITSDTTTSSSRGGFMNTKTTKTTQTTTTIENIASNINIGGDASIESGNDTTIAGSDFNVGGSLTAKTGGDLNIIDRQDRTITDSVTEESGLFVGGGLVGSQKTSIYDDNRVSTGSTVNATKDATLNVGEGLNIIGSEVNVGGNADIDAKDVVIAEGRNERYTETTVETETFGAFTDSGGSASTEGLATDVPGGNTGGGTAKATGSGDLTIGMRTQVTNTKELLQTGTASALNIGGNADIKAENDILVQGSDVNVGGNLDLDAENIISQESRNVHTVTQTVDTTTAGVSFTGSGEASASGSGEYAATGATGRGSASAEGQVGVGLKYQVDNSAASTTTDSARTSTFNVGGDFNRNAENEIKDVGTEFNIGGSVNQSAETFTSLAATSTSTTSTDASSQTARLGLYADASADGSASGSTGGSGMGQGSVGASAGVNASYTRTNDSSDASSVRNQVSNMNVGGSFNSTTTGKTTLQGTNINAGSDVNLAADSLEFTAAIDTDSSNSSSDKMSVEAKLGKGAQAGGSSTGGGSASAGVQGSLGVSGFDSSSSSSSTTSLTGSIGAGGNLNITTTSDARFEGTDLAAQGDANLNIGGNLDFQAARNTSSSSESYVGGEAEVGGGHQGAELSGDASFSSTSSSSNTALTGSISGNNLSINTGGDARFEGTDLTSQGDMTLASEGDVTFTQATSTYESEGARANASLDLSASKSKSGGTDGDGGFSAGGGYSSSSGTTADTSALNSGGRLSITSKNNVTMQGTELDAKEEVNVDASGDLNLIAAEESSESFGVSADVSLMGTKDSGSASGGGRAGSVGGAIGRSQTNTETGVSISGGAVNLKSGGDTTLVGTQVDSTGGVNVTAGGTVTQQAAESSSTGGAIGGSRGSGMAAGTTVSTLSATNESNDQNVSLQSDSGNVTVTENAPAQTEEEKKDEENNPNDEQQTPPPSPPADGN